MRSRRDEDIEMDTSSTTPGYTGLVPSVSDAESGGARHARAIARAFITGGPASRRTQFALLELCGAIRNALELEEESAESSLRRAAALLQESANRHLAVVRRPRGGLASWQLRKVMAYVESRLDQPIRNDELAALARLKTSHFARAFRTSVGEPPHEYVIRRRVARAQGLMLSTNAPLSEIALDCGLADQSHLTRLFRRVVGDSPRAWRREQADSRATECP
jgi:AraC family transcriptional regulator